MFLSYKNKISSHYYQNYNIFVVVYVIKLVTIMETFGKKLTELRKQKGLSQEQLACDLNISQSSISNYEAGVTNPDTEILKRISDYFQIPISNLFSDESLSFYTNENNGGNSGYMINSTLNVMSEKLIELYERIIREKDAQITSLERNLPEKQDSHCRNCNSILT